MIFFINTFKLVVFLVLFGSDFLSEFFNFNLEIFVVVITGDHYQVVSQIGVFWNLKCIKAIRIPSFSASGEVFWTEHLEPFTLMHVRDGVFPASRGFVPTEREDDWVLLSLFFVGVEDLLWMTVVIHFSGIMDSNPVEWLAASANLFTIFQRVLTG
jgi:hypothetical protein